jgi:hypothetical protein
MMRSKRGNTELVDDGVRLIWTVPERHRKNARTELAAELLVT